MLLTAVAAVGCHVIDEGVVWSDAVSGSGTKAEDVRNFSRLRGVHLATVGDLRVEQGDKDQLVIEADDNLIKYIATSVKDGILRIDIEEGVSIRTRSALRFTLTTSSFEMLSTSSSGDITARDLKGEHVALRVSSSGDISVQDVEAKSMEISTSSSGDISVAALRAQELDVKLSSSGDVAIRDGSVERQEVRISSSGDYQATDLRSLRAVVSTSSSGDAKLWVVDHLRASSSSSGSVRFRGNPKVESRTSSSGDIERLP
jgi:DUF4097 and DUF4098 domain-containing protein YvlB